MMANHRVGISARVEDTRDVDRLFLARSIELRRKEGLSAQFDLPGGILSAELQTLSYQNLCR
jgi:hypothetical protein